MAGRAIIVGLAVAVVPILATVVMAATTKATITPTSIAGAKLGLGKIAYRRLLGTPVRFQAAGGGDLTEPGFQEPQDYTRLVFSKRKIDVYFQGGDDHAIQITTWNKAYKTAEGVGPCSTFARVKAAYGGRLKPNPANTTNAIYSYTVGRGLIFEFADHPPHLGTPSPFVTSVALFDARGPAWNRPSGPLYFASFVASAPDQVPCTP